MDANAPIPAPLPDDDEDVNWALSTASALWGRGERAEALKWLRRAAEQASDANADARALELFKAAADVASKMSAPPPPPARQPSAAPARMPSVAPPLQQAPPLAPPMGAGPTRPSARPPGAPPGPPPGPPPQRPPPNDGRGPSPMPAQMQQHPPPVMQQQRMPQVPPGQRPPPPPQGRPISQQPPPISARPQPRPSPSGAPGPRPAVVETQRAPSAPPASVRPQPNVAEDADEDDPATNIRTPSFALLAGKEERAMEPAPMGEPTRPGKTFVIEDEATVQNDLLGMSAYAGRAPQIVEDNKVILAPVLAPDAVIAPTKPEKPELPRVRFDDLDDVTRVLPEDQQPLPDERAPALEAAEPPDSEPSSDSEPGTGTSVGTSTSTTVEPPRDSPRVTPPSASNEGQMIAPVWNPPIHAPALAMTTPKESPKPPAVVVASTPGSASKPMAPASSPSPPATVLRSLMVAVVPTGARGEARIIPLEAGSMPPEGASMAILVPMSEMDGDAIARLFGV